MSSIITAEDLMNHEVVTVPLQMPIREAARLIHRAGAREAAVVDEHGRCVGMLSPEDVFRWIDAGCPEVALKLPGTCPYQVRGRLLSGVEAVICILAHGDCHYQATYPGLGGAHSDVCMRPETADSPFTSDSCYMTTDVATVRPETPLPELVGQITGTRADRLFVVDECKRPIGILSAAEVLNAAAWGKDHNGGSRNPLVDAEVHA